MQRALARRENQEIGGQKTKESQTRVKKWMLGGRRPLKDTNSDVEAGESGRITAEGSLESHVLMAEQSCHTQATPRQAARVGSRGICRGPDHVSWFPVHVFLPQVHAKDVKGFLKCGQTSVICTYSRSPASPGLSGQDRV